MHIQLLKQALAKHQSVPPHTLLKHSFGVDFRYQSVQLHDKKLTNSGLAYNHLKLAFDGGGGAESLESVLSEKQQDGDARVTKNKSFITKLYSHFSTCSYKFLIWNQIYISD